MSSEERTPLLNGRAAGQQQPSEPKEEYRSWTKKIRAEWPVLRILFAFSLWNLAIFGPLASRLDRLRGFVCADYYSQNPDIIQQILLTKTSPCGIPEVEAKVSNFSLIVDLTHASAAAFGLLFYSSLISTKGRKPVWVIGSLAGIFHLLPYAALPLGPPLNPGSEELFFSPRTTLYLLYGSSLIAGLLAFEDLSPLVSKALMADISSPQLRMRNLTWLMIAMLISAGLGPALFSAIIRFLPPLTASSLHRSWSTSLAPSYQADFNSHNNILPFLVGIALQISSAAWVMSLIPESAGLRDTDKETPQTTPRSRLSVLSILLPKTAPSSDSDSNSLKKRDWRITRLTLVGQAGIAGSQGLQTLILFCGYFLQWSPDQVGIIISWLGSVRALVLILLVPIALSLLSRVVKKPKELHRLSKEDMERISKNPVEIEEVLEREDELEHDIEIHQDRDLSQQEEEIRKINEMQENLIRDESLRKQLSLWRANVDLYLLKGSFFLDSAGWIITTAGAQSLHSLPLYIGGLFVSFGVGANGAIISVAIAVITDLHNLGYDVGRTAQEATDKLLGAITITEAIGRFWSPIISTIIYRTSLTSFPGASFLYSSFMYGLAFVLLLGIRADRG